MESSADNCNQMQSGREAVVVTGASSGIGEACALRLARDGFTVFAGVRSPEDEQRLAAAWRGRIVPFILDVTSESSILRAENFVRGSLPEGPGLKGLINNAGISVVGPVETLHLDNLRQQFEVNVTGQVAVSQAFLPLLRQGQGRIVNMGSLTGRLAFPLAGPYAASKAAIAAMTDSLRQEVDKWGIRVCLIEPGNIKTAIWDKHIAHLEKLQSGLPPEKRALYEDEVRADERMVRKLQGVGTPPEAVARAVSHALTADHPKTRYLVGTDSRLAFPALKVVPDRVRDLLVKQWIERV